MIKNVKKNFFFKKKKNKREVSQQHERGLVGTAESLEQQEREPQRGQHDSTRPQPEDNASSLAALRGVYAASEEAWANLENENSEGVTLCADACVAMDELAKAQQHQARCQEEVRTCRESLDLVVTKLKNCWALLDAACDDLEDSGTKPSI